MKFSQKILSQTITQLCLDYGVNHIVISPGSRNAPLTIGFTENPSFKNFSIVDERCAGFFALGIAQQTKKPVAVVCTSGSALLNYYPAVVEAFYSDIPLVVISADRPAHLIDVGDGQTIRQENVYDNHICYSANCLEGERHQQANEYEISMALATAINQRGPVHINVPFSEPLYNKVDEASIVVEKRVTLEEEVVKDSDVAHFKEFIATWNKCSKKMIVVGTLPPNSLEKTMIDFLAKDDSVIVLTETTSNLHHEVFFSAIDQLIAPLKEDEYPALQPELLLTLGGMIVSKKIKKFLRTFGPNAHYHVDPKTGYDTFFALTHHFTMQPSQFFRMMIKNKVNVHSTYRRNWILVKQNRLQRHVAYTKGIPFSDFKAFSTLFETLPSGIQLQLANSATVRYAQLFPLHNSVEVFCNRGTSGIDGSTSTAIGAAYASHRTTVFVTGDLSFFYDSNALWNSYIPTSFRIIVVNNNGGGIFRILPGAKEQSEFQTFFETKHSMTAKPLCDLYQLEYRIATNEKELENQLVDFYTDDGRPKLLEIMTPSEENDKVLVNYFHFLGSH